MVHLHATASDPNGETLAYAWTFEDYSFSSNNLPWTSRSWNINGDRVIRCVVSHMKGGVASANALVPVGVQVGYRLSGRIVDTNGIPIEGVRVDNGTNIPAIYRGCYTQ